MILDTKSYGIANSIAANLVAQGARDLRPPFLASMCQVVMYRIGRDTSES
jgi:hypothetical protein